MTRMMRSMVVCALANTAGVAMGQSYEAVPLGTLGGSTSTAWGVNTAAQVVGESDTLDGPRHAFIWENGVMTDLGTLPGGDMSGAFAINDAGVIVGFSKDGSGIDKPVRWNRVGTSWQIVELPTLGGPLGRASNVSPNGLIVGYASVASGPYHTTVWDTTDAPFEYVPISDPTRRPFGLGKCVNDAGEVVGIEYTPIFGFGDLGIYYTAAGLPTNLTPEGSFVTAHPEAINASGLIAGYFAGPRLTDGQDRAAYYVMGTGWQVLPLVAGYDASQGYGLNDDGIVVGTCYSSDFEGPQPVAFLSDGEGTLDLNAATTGSATRITEARDITNSGLIAANSNTESGSLALLLRPATGIPCPADFNQDGGVDGSDVGAFFIAWEAAENSADVNQDGGVDGGDVQFFFMAWEQGGC